MKYDTLVIIRFLVGQTDVAVNSAPFPRLVKRGNRRRGCATLGCRTFDTCDIYPRFQPAPAPVQWHGGDEFVDPLAFCRKLWIRRQHVIGKAKAGCLVAEIMAEQSRAFGDKAMSRAQVYDIVKKVKNGENMAPVVLHGILQKTVNSRTG